MTEPVGRDRVLAELDRLLDEAASGHPIVVVVHGPRGSGKTAVLDAFFDRHQDQLVRVSAGGVPWETHVPFGLASQLAGEHVGFRLGGGFADAQNAATVGERLASIWTKLSKARPCVVVVDDAQYGDHGSLQALASSYRRLSGAKVLVVVTLQDDIVDADHVRSYDMLARLTQHHLSLDALRPRDVQSLARSLGVVVSLSTARRLTDHCQGNPGVIRQLLVEHPPEYWRERHERLAAPGALVRSVAQRLAELSPGARSLAEASAVLGQRSTLAEAAALADLSDAVPAFDELHAAGLISLLDTQGVSVVKIVDPMMCAAMYAAVGPLRRRELHRVAATVVATEAGRLGHLAAADPLPSEALAERLQACADRLARAGEWAAAAQSYLTAGRMSPDPSAQDRRLLLGVEALIGAGDVPEATDHLPEVEACPPSALRDTVLGYLAVVRGRAEEADRYLTWAWAQVDVQARQSDRPVAGMIARHRVLDSLSRWDGAAIVRWGREALDLDQEGGAPAVEATAILGLGLGTTGRADEARDIYDRALGELAASPQWQRALIGRGWLDLATDDVVAARRALESASPTIARGGSARIALWARAWLARAQLQLGDWDGAWRSVEEGMALLDRSGVDLQRPLIHWTGAQLCALRGQPDAAEEFLRGLEGRSHDYAVMEIPTLLARAQCCEVVADYPGALRALRPLAAFPVDHDINEPGFWPWQDVYANALVLTGRLDEAHTFLTAHQERAARRGHRSMTARLAAVRARYWAATGDVVAAQASLDDALSQLAGLPLPYDRARARFIYGQTLRRAGKRREAEGMLQEARNAFASLGAQTYVDRCDRELTASGLRPRRDAVELQGLTPQERTVATLVAEGKSNKEVAVELFLSVKTVQFHLTRIYGKVGVRSRGELAARFRGEESGESAS